VTRRLFYVAFGAAAGVLAVRRASQAAQRYTPAGMQDRASGAMGSVSAGLREMWADLKDAMSEREDELRSGLGLDGTNDLIDQSQP
jgi:hypothetical protein